VWRALIRPPFNIIDPEILGRGQFVFPIVELLFACSKLISVFYLEQQDTEDLAIFICGMHAGIGLAMGMSLFAFIMIILM